MPKSILSLCISDSNKELLLRSDFDNSGKLALIPHLITGLWLDADRPPRPDVHHDVKAAVQRDYAECLLQARPASARLGSAQPLRATSTLSKPPCLHE